MGFISEFYNFKYMTLKQTYNSYTENYYKQAFNFIPKTTLQ